MATVLATPGVYIEEKSAFPNSAVPVATAVPAFIGYTKKATRDKKDLTNHPTRISSFGEYLLYFGGGPDTRYDLAASADKQRIYELATKTGTRFLLYYSIKLFFANGGSDCYIVSIGDYRKPPTLTDFNDEKPDTNGDIQQKGILTLLKEPEPTMLVIPDAVLLGADDCAALQQLMLAHCQKMASRVSILDVFMDENAKTKPDTRSIVLDFRNKIGTNNLMWGAAYYPWVRTNITGADAVSYNNVDKESWDDLIKLVSDEVDESIKEGLDKKRGESIKSEVKRIQTARIEAANGRVLAATKAKAAADAQKVITGKAVTDAGTAAAAGADKAKLAIIASAVKADAEAATAVAVATAVEAAATAVFNAATLKAKWDAAATDAKEAAKGLFDAENAKVTKLAKDAEDAEKLIDDKKVLLEAADTDPKKAAAQTEVDKAVVAAAAAAAAAKVPAEAETAADAAEVTLNQTLLAISPLYKSIMATLREKLNLLPPSAGLAGIYSMVDNQIGVFQSPANVSIGSVIQPAVNMTNDEQEDLNVPLNGKAVNAIRTFAGKGVLIWGARTLDGNSQDWRYVSVRRTVIFIEQSIKYATEPYVFAPNVSSTWTNIKAMITNFLTNVWQSGALAGAVPADAFSVDVGLGATMTPVDILDGIMRITVKIAVTRPAEFIVITFQQKMQQS
jgi:phage tail sheath protein FI